MSLLDRALEWVGLRRIGRGLPLTGRANYCPVCGRPLVHADVSAAKSDRGRDLLARTGRCPEHGWLVVEWDSIDK